MNAHEKHTVRAQEFILESTQGRELAALRQDNEGNTLLNFAGPDGAPRMSLSTAPNGTPRITLFYANGMGSIEIEANDVLNSAGMIIVGPKGRVQALLGITADGLPVFALLDENGSVIFTNLNTRCQKSPGPAAESFDWDRLLRE